ncbi:MAG: response regulator [Anaerolineaceae bacterium]|nr:response regulator [Anaerolineaceae bacterium]
MAFILLIDDEVIFHRMIEHALKPMGHVVYTEMNGLQGLEAARLVKPDLIITDLNLPDISGYEVTRRLRRDPLFAHVPIIVLTSHSGLQDKLGSFESGADDHITKPFEPEELIARMGVLLRKRELLRYALPEGKGVAPERQARLIAVHSLRGGIGTSTLAVNLAIGLRSLWEMPTLLLDLVLMAGQAALLLNQPLKRTWADLTGVKSEEIDAEMIHSIVDQHPSGLEFIAAPTYPSEAEMLNEDALSTALNITRPMYEYIVADLPHDFGEVTLQALDFADVIVLIAAPELSSIRATAAALDTYRKLGYPPDKIKLVLNNIFPRHGLPRERIETALEKPISLVLPYAQDILVQAINIGRPILYHQPETPFASLVEDLTFFLSKETHRKAKPENPTPAWKRVYNRAMKARRNREK